MADRYLVKLRVDNEITTIGPRVYRDERHARVSAVAEMRHLAPNARKIKVVEVLPAEKV